jgi:hypothetical protein
VKTFRKTSLLSTMRLHFIHGETPVMPFFLAGQWSDYTLLWSGLPGNVIMLRLGFEC